MPTEPTQKIKPRGFLEIINPLGDTQESLTMSLNLFISALTLVAGLAWNDAIKGLITNVVQPLINDPLNKSLGQFAAVVAPFFYAVVITLFVVYVVNRTKKLEERLERRREEKQAAQLKEIVKAVKK